MKLLLTSRGVTNPSIHRRSYSSSADRSPSAMRGSSRPHSGATTPVDGSVQVISERR